jgi:murein DD-endopeptidase MepM/ murein hydrolase activator NlpD
VRSKAALKNARGGLAGRGAGAGEEIRASRREADFDLRGARQGEAAFSQAGKSSGGKPDRKQARQPERAEPAHGAASGTSGHSAPQFGGKAARPGPPPRIAGGPAGSAPAAEAPQTAAPAGAPKAAEPMRGGAAARTGAPPPKRAAGKPESPLRAESRGRLNFAREEAAPAPEGKREQPKPPGGRAEPAAEAAQSGEPPKPAETPKAGPPGAPQPAGAPNPASGAPGAPPKPNKPGRLQFAAGEAPPGKAKIGGGSKPGNAQKQAGKAAGKLETAEPELPQKKKTRAGRAFDEKAGEPKRKLRFESEAMPRAGRLGGPLPLRPAKAAGGAALALGHREMFQDEKENAGTEAAHRGEMAAEGAARAALRHRRTAPRRKAARLERKSARKQTSLSLQKATAENPGMKSGPLARLQQKRKIRKDYAKAAREAATAAGRAKSAGSAAAGAARALAGAAGRHPAAAAAAALAALALYALASLAGALGGMGGGGLGGALAASYLAEDADIDSAELAYTEWEADLQLQIAGAESARPGYDEYRRSAGEISHSPHELMAYLTAKRQNFSYPAVEPELRALFSEQYALAFTATAETRHRTVTKTDPKTGKPYSAQEAYDWRVLTVTLAARPFSEVALGHLGGDESARYALLLLSKGNRQLLANPLGDLDWIASATGYYGWRADPESGGKELSRGVDIAAAPGAEIRSGQDGTVAFAGHSDGYGNTVVIEGAGGLASRYAHCGSLLAAAGQAVKAGDAIATAGEAGLRLEVLKDGAYLNPIFFAASASRGGSGSPGGAPGWADPGAPMGDGSYGALMAEAERHLSKPYVWGASGPNSFDCSGFVCYAYRVSGVYDFGRITANAIYSRCAPVSPGDAKPGDIVAFHSTYSAAAPVTHVGIYAGADAAGRPRMLHAGSPVQYAYIDTPYWQEHFYGFGRIN